MQIRKAIHGAKRCLQQEFYIQKMFGCNNLIWLTVTIIKLKWALTTRPDADQTH
jgi:hypothetical protein